MKLSTLFGITLLACSSALVAQEVIVLDGDLPSPPKGIRRTTDQPAPPAAQAQSSPTGIRAQIMVADGRSRSLRAAAPNDVFMDGQRFRLRVTSGAEGHLYVLCQNSQGNANILFPTLDTDALGSEVGGRVAVTIPDSGWFEFDSEPGIEQVFLLVSARPLNDLDRAVEQGGDLAPDVLQRYATGRPARRAGPASKGVVFTGSDILVRRLELVHESRN